MAYPYVQSDFPSGWDNLGGVYGSAPQSVDFAGAMGALGFVFGAYMVLVLVAVVVVYIMMAMSLMRISQKTKIGTPWFAWVPILNSILLLNLAGLSGWYVVLILVLAGIPILGWIALVLFSVYIWMKVSVVCKKPDYLGLLAAIPPMTILLLLYLAYSDKLTEK